MRKLLFAAFTLLTFKASAQNCACIQVMNTDNISQVQKESFAFTSDTALIEKTDKNTYRVMFCYANFGIAMRESNTFQKNKYNPVIVERKKEQIETMQKLSNI
jgi:hypothetical protein